MWILTKTVFLTAFAWGVATVAFSLVAYLAWSRGSMAFGLQAPDFLTTFGAVGTLVTVVAAVRFAAVAPIIFHERTSYGSDWTAIAWPPKPETKVSTDVRIPSELTIRMSGGR